METLFVHLLIGPLLLLIFYIVKARPPKKINKLYGYRTPASMRSQATWDFANAYSTDWMIKLMWVLVFVVQLPLALFTDPEVSISVSVGIMLVFLIVPIILTERRLRQIFDDEGNYREEFV